MFLRVYFVWRVFWYFRYYILSVGLLLALWDFALLKPLRVFVVMIHEMCHAAAALVSGGQVVEIRTNWNESGHTLTQGGFFPLISSAGYVGSALVGATIIYAGSYPVFQRVILFLVGTASTGMTLCYTPVGGLDFYLGVGGGGFLAMIALRSGRFATVCATVLGIMLCLYSLYDFRTDLWMHTEKTDAGILANYWAEDSVVLPYVIAIFWVVLSLSFMYQAMRALARNQIGTELEIRALSASEG